MIRAPIPARTRAHGPNIPRRDLGHIARQTRIHIIRIHRQLPARRIPRHVLIQHRQHRLPGRFIVLENIRRPQQPALLARVKVELERVLGRELGRRQHPQRLEDHDAPGPVVLGARAAGGGAAAGGVEVGADDDEVGGRAGDAGDDGLLGEGGVRELRDGDGGVGGRDGLDGVEEPGGGFDAVRAAVVAGLEVGEGA